MQLCTLSMPLVRSFIVTCLATLSGNGGHGVAFEKLKSDEVRELEPGLSRDYQRGIFFPGVTSPLALVEGLMGRAAALGVANRTARVLAIEPGVDEVTLQTNTGASPLRDRGHCSGHRQPGSGPVPRNSLSLASERGYHITVPGISSVISRPRNRHRIGLRRHASGRRAAHRGHRGVRYSRCAARSKAEQQAGGVRPRNVARPESRRGEPLDGRKTVDARQPAGHRSPPRSCQHPVRDWPWPHGNQRRSNDSGDHLRLRRGSHTPALLRLLTARVRRQILSCAVLQNDIVHSTK